MNRPLAAAVAELYRRPAAHRPARPARHLRAVPDTGTAATTPRSAA